LPSPGDQVLDGVWFGAHPRMIRRLLKTNGPDPEGGLFRLFVGYAGWSAGQLEREIDEGAWKIVPAAQGTFFGGNTQSLWAEMMLRSWLPCGENPALIRDAWMN
jgi:putative transcriptional regulator